MSKETTAPRNRYTHKDTPRARHACDPKAGAHIGKQQIVINGLQTGPSARSLGHAHCSAQIL
jgi:hypothetical protein